MHLSKHSVAQRKSQFHEPAVNGASVADTSGVCETETNSC
jgi:hypothetical protein